MSWQDAVEGIRQNASSGDPWCCSQKQAGLCAGLFTKLFFEVVNELGYGLDPKDKDDVERVRRSCRLPFYSYVFGREIPSSNFLLVGEASALLNFAQDHDYAWGVLFDWWLEEMGAPYTEELWAATS